MLTLFICWERSCRRWVSESCVHTVSPAKLVVDFWLNAKKSFTCAPAVLAKHVPGITFMGVFPPLSVSVCPRKTIRNWCHLCIRCTTRVVRFRRRLTLTFDLERKLPISHMYMYMYMPVWPVALCLWLHRRMHTQNLRIIAQMCYVQMNAKISYDFGAVS